MVEDDMDSQHATAADLLAELLKIASIEQVIAVGKDGFVIESMGSGRTKDVEQLGATLAAAVNEMEKLGRTTNCGDLDNITIAFADVVVFVMATANAVIAAISSDNTSQGFLRIKMNALMPALEPLL
jgi:predicted regulator of Ras-like GTPase activity (Roadblock/LC7/MglB family)